MTTVSPVVFSPHRSRVNRITSSEHWFGANTGHQLFTRVANTNFHFAVCSNGGAYPFRSRVNTPTMWTLGACYHPALVAHGGDRSPSACPWFAASAPFRSTPLLVRRTSQKREHRPRACHGYSGGVSFDRGRYKMRSIFVAVPDVYGQRAIASTVTASILALLSDESQDCLISLVEPVNASFWSLTVAVGRKTWTRVFDGPFEQTAESMTAALEAPTQLGLQ